jgi:hypothetical protein
MEYGFNGKKCFTQNQTYTDLQQLSDQVQIKIKHFTMLGKSTGPIAPV